MGTGVSGVVMGDEVVDREGDNGGIEVKTSTDEHQFAEHLAVRARLASCPVICRGSYSLEGMGHLILGLASRLDAFSGYPFQT